MNNRIKEIRKDLDLSQEDFAGRLGITGSGLSNIENGKRNVTEQMILAICREFNVNEDWLRTGEGGKEAMFDENDNANIAAVVADFDLDKMSEVILTAYVDMDAKKRAALNNFVRELSDGVMREQIEKARIKVNEIILNSRATDAVKIDLTGKATGVFIETFSHIGIGNVDESEMQAANSDEQEKEALHARLDEQLAKEKKQESKVSFVKESDVG